MLSIVCHGQTLDTLGIPEDVKQVAVVGAGIAGLAAAYVLSRRHQVHVFEREPRLGGHTHTVDVESAAGPVRLDTGFLVHNQRTYPNLVRLFQELGVRTQDSEMSFSVACRGTGLEYSSRGLQGFFAQPRNLVRASHLRLLREIVRFNREAKTMLRAPGEAPTTLGRFLEARRFGADLTQAYVLPMASAIWSASIRTIRDFPVQSLLRFLDNHGLLSLTSQPTWRVVVGGSDTYIAPLTAPFRDRIHRGASLRAVVRAPGHVTLYFADREPMRVDEVVFACHGDQVLPLLADATPREREVLGAFTTTTNDVWLHSDTSVLPRSHAAHASWNYRVSADPDAPPTVTYDLNRLQRLTTRERYCVTLNPTEPLDPARTIRRLSYRHPQMTPAAVRAQGRWGEVSGVDRVHFCGAYWGYGFHEDGLNSGLRVADALGVPW